MNSKRIIIKKFLVEIIAFLFILLFLYAAGTKLVDIERFRIVISKSPVLYSISDRVSIIIPTAEILLSFLIAIPRARFFGLLGAFTLMVIFTAYIVVILQFSEEIPCACGGVLQSLGWKEHLIFNIVFSLIALTGVLLELDSKRHSIIKRQSI